MVEVNLYLYPPPDLNLYDELERDIDGTYSGDYNSMINDCDFVGYEDHFSFMTKFDMSVNSDPVDIFMKDYKHLLNNRPGENQEKLSIKLIETDGEILPKADVIDTDGEILTTYEEVSESIYKFNFVFYKYPENNYSDRTSERTSSISLYFATPYISNNHFVSLRNKYI